MCVASDMVLGTSSCEVTNFSESMQRCLLKYLNGGAFSQGRKDAKVLRGFLRALRAGARTERGAHIDTETLRVFVFLVNRVCFGIGVFLNLMCLLGKLLAMPQDGVQKIPHISVQFPVVPFDPGLQGRAITWRDESSKHQASRKHHTSHQKSYIRNHTSYIQYPVSSIQYPVSSIQYPASSNKHPAP